MTNKEAIRVMQTIKEHPSLYVYLPHEYEALDLAIKALEFAESQRACCDNCVNHNRKSKEICTSPYGQCEFFEDETQ